LLAIPTPKRIENSGVVSPRLNQAFTICSKRKNRFPDTIFARLAEQINPEHPPIFQIHPAILNA